MVMHDLVQDDAGFVSTLNVVQDAVQYGSVCCMFYIGVVYYWSMMLFENRDSAECG
jgi:hypothetical protein